MMRKIGTLLTLSLFALGAFSQGYDSLNVSLLFHWSDSTIPPAQIHGNNYNEVWGYAKDGKEYAIIGTTLGTHFFDITNPASASQVAYLQGAVSSSVVIHRDMKTYADHLFIVADEGTSTMQVVDLQYLPDSIVTVYDDNALLYRAHNIFIDTVHARLYTCGGNSHMSIYDISTPSAPALLKNCQTDVSWWSSTIAYVHDAYVNDHIGYLNATDAMYVVDFSDVNSINIVGSLENYPDQGYNHSGWINEAGTHYTMCDETHGMQAKLLDVTDLTDIQVSSLFGSGVHANSIVHNVAYTGNVLHASYYHDGYWLWDHSDPANPALLGYYDTSQEQHLTNYKGAWGVYPFLPSGVVLVSDMQEGLFVFDISQATSIANGGSAIDQNIHVWPNPTSGVFSVRVPGAGNDKLNVDVFNSIGKLVHSSQSLHSLTGGMDIDLSELSTGLYSVRVRNGSSSWTTSIVKH